MERLDIRHESPPHAQRGFGLLIHLAAYLAITTGLVLFNLPLAPERTWFYWPLFGWGIGLLCHSLAAFLSVAGAGWQQGMIERELNRLK